MIHGIGTDIIEIKRIANAVKKHEDKFINKVFTMKETTYLIGKHFRPNSELSEKVGFQSLAGIFAAKEAVIKALGIGFGNGIGFTDIIINRIDNKPPMVLFSKKLLLKIKELNVSNVLVSISHEKDYALAYAIAIRG